MDFQNIPLKHWIKQTSNILTLKRPMPYKARDEMDFQNIPKKALDKMDLFSNYIP